MDMRMKTIHLFLIVSFCIFLLPGCGGAIDDAQNFSPNIPPKIKSMTGGIYPSSLAYDPAALVNHMTFDIAVTAEDPENQNLSYTYTSDHGSFAGQSDTPTGSTVKFVTGSLKAGDNVAVMVTVSDTKRGASVYSLPIGTGKAVPTVTVVTPAPAHIALNDATRTITVQADCDGFFQVLEDNSGTASTVHFDGAGMSFVPVDKGNSVSLSIPAHSATGTYKIWVLFLDYIDQEAVPVLSTIIVP
jgi:hypothetical protein